MESLYPLSFQPIFRRYIWGGRRLESQLGKQLPKEGDDYAESWEVVDHGDDQSVVATGELKGWTLSRLVTERGKELLGRHHPQQQFPLLFKFLDCQRNLSVQVHPNDAQAGRLEPPDLGKTEAWLILATEPGSRLYAGLKPNVDRDLFEHAILDGVVEEYLHQVQPKIGDCIFIPAGTVHALGEGLVVAEIQQSSNTTYRLFDWNRTSADGKPRQLHVDQGLDVIDFSSGPVKSQPPCLTEDLHVERLVECEKFLLDRLTLTATEKIGGDDACHIVAVLEGSVDLAGTVVSCGETMLLPASCGKISVTPQARAVMLDMYLP